MCLYVSIDMCILLPLFQKNRSINPIDTPFYYNFFKYIQKLNLISPQYLQTKISNNQNPPQDNVFNKINNKPSYEDGLLMTAELQNYNK